MCTECRSEITKNVKILQETIWYTYNYKSVNDAELLRGHVLKYVRKSSLRLYKGIVCILLGIFRASDCDLPTFRNLLSVPSSKAECRLLYM
jgi:hypothetical protein